MRQGTMMVAIVLAAMATPTWAKRQESTENTEQVVETKAIPFTTEYKFSRDVGAGRLVKAQAGENGHIDTRIRVIKKDGKVMSREVIGTVRFEPKNTIFLMGKTGYPTSRGSFSARKVIDVVATAYEPMAGEGRRWGGKTKIGVKARYGVIAVDPRVIPLGSFVYVEGYGFAYAADTGSAIKGKRIDLCMATDAECNRFGRRKVRIHVLSAR